MKTDPLRSRERAVIEATIREISGAVHRRLFGGPKWTVTAHLIGQEVVYVAFHEDTMSASVGSSPGELAERMRLRFGGREKHGEGIR